MIDTETTYPIITLIAPIRWRSNGQIFLDIGEKGLIKKSTTADGVYTVMFLNPEYEITFDHASLLQQFDNKEVFKFLLVS